ncbi:MAG: hypothetical protein K2X93_05485 [Candidatus Obscuribacterales bacterium]|nr:hypothetical protein [Candidatus Obscuribacterales bacterium]
MVTQGLELVATTGLVVDRLSNYGQAKDINAIQQKTQLVELIEYSVSALEKSAKTNAAASASVKTMVLASSQLNERMRDVVQIVLLGLIAGGFPVRSKWSTGLGYQSRLNRQHKMAVLLSCIVLLNAESRVGIDMSKMTNTDC